MSRLYKLLISAFLAVASLSVMEQALAPSSGSLSLALPAESFITIIIK